MKRYFAYGMNLDPSYMEGMTRIGPARLYGWRLDFRCFAVVEEAAPEEYVEGALFELTDDQLERLDYREGYPRMYSRQELTVQEPHQESTALVYYPTGLASRHGDGIEYVPPGPGYLDIIEEGYRYWQLPPQKLNEALARCDYNPNDWRI